MHLAPSSGERRARSVEQLAIVVHRLLQPALDAPRQRLRAKRKSERRLLPHSPQVIRHSARSGDQPPQGCQLAAVEQAALDAEPGQCRRYVVHRFREQAITPPEEHRYLLHPSKFTRDPAGIRGGAATADALRAQGTGGAGGHQLQHGAELNGVQRVEGEGILQNRRGASLLFKAWHPVGNG